MNGANGPHDIRCLCLDVDGVLTDGSIITDEEGHSLRRFHVHDGFALRWWQQLGGIVLLCSGKLSPAVSARARELGIERVIQGSADKVRDVERELQQLGLTWAQVAAVGDDLPDIPVLRRCALPIAVADAVEEVKAIARLVTSRPGGRGAVREALEYILRDNGRWAELLAHYGVAE